ncbi:mediator of rna polymerase ii transcription subunit 25-like isoform x6, partial [Haematococcus lacustris]
MEPARDPRPPCRLVLVVEVGAAMGTLWPELRKAYVEPLLHAAEAPQGPLWPCELALVLGMLDGIDQAGGGLGEVALGEALLEVMHLAALPSALSAAPFPCHCFVVAVSEPQRQPVVVPLAPRHAMDPNAAAVLGLGKDLTASPTLALLHSYRPLPNGMWAHDYSSLAATLRQEPYNVTLSYATSKDKRTQQSYLKTYSANWLQLPVTADMDGALFRHRDVIHRMNVTQ